MTGQNKKDSSTQPKEGTIFVNAKTIIFAGKSFIPNKKATSQGDD